VKCHVERLPAVGVDWAPVAAGKWRCHDDRTEVASVNGLAAVLRLSGGFAGRKLGDAICLFTDGEDTVDARDPNAVVTAVAGTGVRIFVVRPHPDRPTARWSETATAFLPSIAEATGGSVGWLGEQRERSHTFYSMMAEAYRLELVFPRVVDEPRKWKLQVVSPDGKSLPKVRLVYPHLIAPLVPGR
jgi:hypothetical protein